MGSHAPFRVLMCEPTYFDVPVRDRENNYMNPANRPNRGKALVEHHALRELYEQFGGKVFFMDPVPGLSDMTFTANCGFTFASGRDEKSVILSNFKRKRRRGEKKHVHRFFTKLGYAIHELPNKIFFEGAGDTLVYCGKILFGYGFRSDEAAIPHLERLTGMEVSPLPLQSPGPGRKNPYHLDTAIMPLEAVKTIIANIGAFPSEAIKRLEQLGEIKPAAQEDAENLVLNAVVIEKEHLPLWFTRPSPVTNGVAITSDLASDDFLKNVRGIDYVPFVVPLGEFLKSGAGAFCLTKILC